MNIATDVIVTPSSLNKSSWSALKRIAAEGSDEQQHTLLAWSYSAIPAALSEELHFIVYGWGGEKRYLANELTESMVQLRQRFEGGKDLYDLEYDRAVSRGAS